MSRDRFSGEISTVEIADRFVVLVILCFIEPYNPSGIVVDFVEHI